MVRYKLEVDDTNSRLPFLGAGGREKQEKQKTMPKIIGVSGLKPARGAVHKVGPAVTFSLTSFSAFRDLAVCQSGQWIMGTCI